MSDYLDKLEKDMRDYRLPRKLSSLKKLKCPLKVGSKVRWYYKDEAKFWKKEGLKPREWTSYYGLVIPKPDVESRTELEPENCVIVVLGYPCEKCGPEVDWVALNRMLDNDDLVEVFA